MSQIDEQEQKRLEKERLQELEYRKIVLEGVKGVYAAGLSQMGEGNVSTRVKKKDEMFITPSQNDYATMTIEDVVHIKFNGEHLSKGRRASSEYMLHKAIYEARPKAICAIHAHPKHCVMLSVVGMKLPMIIEEMAFFIGGEVNVTEFAASGTEELGKVVAETMGNANAVLIRNHGLFVCARDMETAVKTAMLVEKMAEIYIGCVKLGNVTVMNTEQTKKWIEMFDALNRTAPIIKKEENKP